jgi:hypothetical protein
MPTDAAGFASMPEICWESAVGMIQKDKAVFFHNPYKLFHKLASLVCAIGETMCAIAIRRFPLMYTQMLNKAEREHRIKGRVGEWNPQSVRGYEKIASRSLLPLKMAGASGVHTPGICALPAQDIYRHAATATAIKNGQAVQAFACTCGKSPDYGNDEIVYACGDTAAFLFEKRALLRVAGIQLKIGEFHRLKKIHPAGRKVTIDFAANTDYFPAPD